MNEIKKEDIKQEVFDLYDDYAHNRVSRRDFVQKLSAYAVGGLTVTSLLSFLSPDYQGAIQVKPNDPRLKFEYINYQSPKGGGNIKALLSMPANNKKKLGGIVVVHENRGLNPHIEDVARRAALAGFISLAPDALTPLGGYPGSDDEGRALQSKRDRYEMLEDFIAAYHYLKNHKDCNGKVGVVGFCFGGWIANMMAVRIPDLSAAVPFYGGQPETEDVPKIKAPLLLHYAELDTRVNEGWPAYEAALKANHKEYKAYMYGKTNHGFHNDTPPAMTKPPQNSPGNEQLIFLRRNWSKEKTLSLFSFTEQKDNITTNYRQSEGKKESKNYTFMTKVQKLKYQVSYFLFFVLDTKKMVIEPNPDIPIELSSKRRKERVKELYLYEQSSKS